MFHYSFYSPILRVCIYVCQSAFVLPVSGGLFFIKKKKKKKLKTEPVKKKKKPELKTDQVKKKNEKKLHRLTCMGPQIM